MADAALARRPLRFVPATQNTVRRLALYEPTCRDRGEKLHEWAATCGQKRPLDLHLRFCDSVRPKSVGSRRSDLPTKRIHMPRIVSGRPAYRTRLYVLVFAFGVLACGAVSAEGGWNWKLWGNKKPSNAPGTPYMTPAKSRTRLNGKPLFSSVSKEFQTTMAGPARGWKRPGPLKTAAKKSRSWWPFGKASK